MRSRRIRTPEAAGQGSLRFTGNAPENSAELKEWILEQLGPFLPKYQMSKLLCHVDRVWQTAWNKSEAVRQAALNEVRRAYEIQLAHKERALQRVVKYTEGQVRTLYSKAVAAEEEKSKDDLTGLWNRSRFFEEFERITSLEKRANWLSVGFIDVGGFKWINDTLGHHTGDRVLQEIAAIMVAQFRQDGSNFIARWGGDEFGFMVVNHARESGVIAAQRFVEAILAHSWIEVSQDLRDHPVRTDIGLVSIPIAQAKSYGIVRLRQEADSLMYESKRRKGRDWITAAILEPAHLSLPSRASRMAR